MELMWHTVPRALRSFSHTCAPHTHTLTHARTHKRCTSFPLRCFPSDSDGSALIAACTSTASACSNDDTLLSFPRYTVAFIPVITYRVCHANSIFQPRDPPTCVLKCFWTPPSPECSRESVVPRRLSGGDGAELATDARKKIGNNTKPAPKQKRTTRLFKTVGISR